MSEKWFSSCCKCKTKLCALCLPVGITRLATCTYSGSRCSYMLFSLVYGSAVCNNGRLRSWRVRCQRSWIVLFRYTTMPLRYNATRLSSFNIVPPPVAKTMLSSSTKSWITLASRWRKPASPSTSKMCGMVTPVRCWISSSLSTKTFPSAFPATSSLWEWWGLGKQP